ncbi:MAG: acyl-CoA dehydrogenase [Gammaproteobacteria bacterium]|nr:acyl-CoA dehydrogenase [Gammaproteobacteria bacterium]
MRAPNPRSIQTRAVRDGDEWVINGHKWFTSNAVRADWALVMARTEEPDGKGGTNEKMSQFIVPTDSPGFEIVRSVPVWGHTGGHHCEILYKDVRIPHENMLGREGQGHAGAGKTVTTRRRSCVPLHEFGRQDVAGFRSDGQAFDRTRGSWRQARDQTVYPGHDR